MKTAIVTGASRGLGLALARGLARDGWALVVDARDAVAIAEAGAELAAAAAVTVVAGDVTDPAHRQALVDAAVALGDGSIDAVVNNASRLGPSPQPGLTAYPIDVLGAVFAVNVVAPIALVQAASERLAPGAAVVNITSDAGVEAYEGWGGYGASKAALEHASAVLAVEHPELRVYWVDPGDLRTQMHQEAFPGDDISDRPLPDVAVPGLLALIEGARPSGRYRAQEVVTVAVPS
jgi:NAD(P)-dependent dehydrogenase (short-subunit alcohol dehydrogenase family)